MGRLFLHTVSSSLLFLAGTTILNAQAPTEPQPETEAGTATIQVRSQLVPVPTTVQTKQGEVIYDLKPSQFVIEDNGVPQRVHLDDAEESTRPLALVVAVQCSRSAIEEFNKLAGLPTMLDALVGAAPAEVAVIQFGTGEELMTGFTRNPQVRDAAITRLRPCEDDGGANIFDAVDYANTLLEAHQALTKYPNARRAVLLISETRDHGSETKPDAVIAELGRTNTVVDAVSFSPGRDEMVNDLKYGGGSGVMGLLFMAVQAARKNAPKEFAALSGGEYINFATQKGFDNGLSTLANHVHNFYLLSFQPNFPAAIADKNASAPGLHKIVVKIPDYPDAIIHHRESYWDGGPDDIKPKP
jgi:VWFA-related protein